MGALPQQLVESLQFQQVVRLGTPTGMFLVEGVKPGMGQITHPDRPDISFRIQPENAVFELPRYIKKVNVHGPVIFLDPDHKDYQSHLSKIRNAKILYVDTETFPIYKWKNQPKRAGLNSWESRIRLIQVFDGQTCYVIDLGGRGLHQFLKKAPPKQTGLEELPLFVGLSDLPEPSPDKVPEGMDNDRGIVRFKSAIATLRFSAKHRPWVFHHAHFDCLRLWQYLGIKVEHPKCTYIGSRIFFGNYGKDKNEEQQDTKVPDILYGGYSLKNLAHRFLGIQLDKTEQLSDWGDTLTQSQIKYACADVFILKPIHDYLIQLFNDTQTPLYYGGLFDIWELENDVIPVLVEAETEGLPYDPAISVEQMRWVNVIKKWLYRPWRKYFGEVIHTNDKDVLRVLRDRYPEIKFPDLKKENLGEPKTPTPKGQPKLPGELPEIKLKLQLDAVDAIRNSVVAFMRSAEAFGIPKTQFRSLTGFGRMSSGGHPLTPNIQSIIAKKNPRIKRFKPPNPRRAIGFPPGSSFKIIIVDLAGAHFRICVDLAKDPNAIEILSNPDAESHSKIGVLVARALGRELTWETIFAGSKGELADPEMNRFCKMCRDTAKNTLYGSINEASAETIQSQIANNTGEIIELEACAAALTGCRQMYPELPKYNQKLRERLLKTRVRIDGVWCAINNLPDGRRIILPLFIGKGNQLEVPYTQAPASTWSGIEATVIKWACREIRKKADRKWGLALYGLVHDELNFKVKEEFAIEGAKLVNHEVGEAFKRLLSVVPDGRSKKPEKSICDSWADK